MEEHRYIVEMRVDLTSVLLEDTGSMLSTSSMIWNSCLYAIPASLERSHQALCHIFQDCSQWPPAVAAAAAAVVVVVVVEAPVDPIAADGIAVLEAVAAL